MDKTRDALEKIANWCCDDPYYAKEDINDIKRVAQEALSAPVASDARELIREIERDSVAIHRTGAYKAAQLAEDNAVMKTEAFSAERERKVREETVDKCIDAVHTWMLRGQSGGEIGLIAKFNAIKEAGNGR